MILEKPEKFLKVDFKDAKQSNFKILDMSEIPYTNDRVKFSWTIELLNIKRYCIYLNKLIGSICKNKLIDHSILDIVNDSILKNVPPDEKNAIRYFEFKRELYLFIKDHYTLFNKSVHVPFESDIFILGLLWDMDSDEPHETLWFKYDILLNDYQTGRMDFHAFYNSVKKEINSKIERN